MGKLYTSTVLFRNVTATSRMIRILPPETKYFCVSLIKYPGDDGVIAPGMACHVNIQFSPDSLSDYDDVFVIISDINRFEVPISIELVLLFLMEYAMFHNYRIKQEISIYLSNIRKLKQQKTYRRTNK